MELKTIGTAGTLESSDAMITIEPSPRASGIAISLESTVMAQYGRQIRETVLEVLSRLGVADARVTVNDRGALDCTLRARVECACYRACRHDAGGKYDWGGAIR